MRAHVEPYRRAGKTVRGRWRIVFELDRDCHGVRKRRVRTVTASGKKDAESRMREFMRQMETSDYVEPSKMLLSQWLDLWLEQYAPLSCLAQSTLVGYRGVVRRYIVPVIGSVRLQRLDAPEVQRMYNQMSERGLSPRTVIQTHAVLRKALSKAVELRYLSFNVCDKGRGVQRPRAARSELVALEPAEQLELLENARGHALFLPVWLALYTGMRRSEILALRWDDVDLEKGTLRVVRAWDTGPAAGNHSKPEDRYRLKAPKSEHGRRSIDLDPDTVKLLRRHLAQQEARRSWILNGNMTTSVTNSRGEEVQFGRLVICRDDGTPWWPDAFSSVWQDFKKRTGTRARFHDLRRTHGSNLLMAGANPKVVQQRLGHHSAAFTLDVYTTVLAGIERESAERAASLIGFDIEERNRAC